MMSRRLAPMARRTPISRRLARTRRIMMERMPNPPTAKERLELMSPSTATRSRACCLSCMVSSAVSTEKSSRLPPTMLWRARMSDCAAVLRRA